MKVGVSTACLYPMETKIAVTQLLENGIDLLEIFFNTISEIQNPYILDLDSMLKSFGAQVKSMHPFTSGYEPYLIFTDYVNRYKDSLEFYKNYFTCAQSLGAKILVIHGDRKTAETGISDEEYFEKFGELANVGRQYGVTVAQENVNVFRSQYPDFIRKMKDYLSSNASFVFDIKQAVRAGVDPYEMCEAMGDRLVHIHINDNNAGNDCLLPGAGDVDYQRLFEILKKNSYSGDFMLEVYRCNYNDMAQLVNSYEYVKKIVSEFFGKTDKD